MKNLILSLTLVLLVSLSSVSQQNQQVNLSLIELKFKIVFANRDMFLRPCLVSEAMCKLSASESKVGVDIINASASYLGIDFQSSSQSPNLFLKDVKGVYQIINTEAQKGALIHVNVDRLLEPLVRLVGVEKVIEYVMMSLFFQATNNWEQSQVVAGKIAKFWSAKFKSFVPLSFKEESIDLTFFHNKEVRILLYDNVQVYVLSYDLIKRLSCANGYIPTIIVGSANEKWTDYQFKNNYTQGKFLTDLSYQCVDSAGKIETWSSTVSLDLQFQVTPLGQKQFVPQNFRMDILKSQKIK